MQALQVLHLDPVQPDPDQIAQAADALAAGELVVVPTETVYGLAADPDVQGAVEKIYAAKQRPEDKEIPRMVSNLKQVEASGAALSLQALCLAGAFWPGPLTLVLPVGSDYVGYRVPNHPVTLALLNYVGKALAVTSANKSGEPPATDADAAAEALRGHVSMVLDAGVAEGGVPSTVVRVNEQGFDILREGAITPAEIERVATGKGL